MRLGCRNNRSGDPLPLALIFEIRSQRIRPPAGEFRHDPSAVPLSKFIGEPFRMGISPELHLPNCLHDTAH